MEGRKGEARRDAPFRWPAGAGCIVSEVGQLRFAVSSETRVRNGKSG